MEKARGAVRLRFGDQALVSAGRLERVSVWSSGLVLDHLSGLGGLPRGRLTGFEGGLGSGKTSLALAVLARTSREMSMSALIDLEGGFDAWALSRFQPDLDSLVLVRPPSLAAGAEAALSLVREGCGLVLLLGQPPHPTLSGLEAQAARSGSMVVVVAGSFSPTLSHSLSLGFKASFRGWVRERRQLIGLRAQLTCLKNRLGAPGRTAEVELRWPLGPDTRFDSIRALPKEDSWARSSAV